jgi:hypothetical protein
MRVKFDVSSRFQPNQKCRLFPSFIVSAILLFPVIAPLRVQAFPVPQIEFSPEHYVCQQTPQSLTIDGILDESTWQAVPWTNTFVDIEGHLKPAPFYDTRVKMLWDETYFYIGAELRDEHLWATLRERDSVIFHDNDFEVFLDPDGDTHHYYELEINSFGTEWDLLLLAPYRDRGRVAVDSWDIAGLKTAVHLDGSLNDASDTDRGWSVEIAIPWQVLEECATKDRPENGDQWRVNFSRVHWDLEWVDGYYQKLDKPEYNWVWSAQGLIAMHYPERWGYVQFVDDLAGAAGTQAFQIDGQRVELESRLWQVYYKQKQFYEDNGFWAKTIDDLDGSGLAALIMISTLSGYEVEGTLSDGRSIRLNWEGRLSQHAPSVIHPLTR